MNEVKIQPQDQIMGVVKLTGESIAKYGSVYEAITQAVIPALEEKFSEDELLLQSQAVFDAYIQKRTGDFDPTQDPVYKAFHERGISVTAPDKSNKVESQNLQHAFHADGIGYLWNFYHDSYRGSAEDEEETPEEKMVRDQVRHLVSMPKYLLLQISGKISSTGKFSKAYLISKFLLVVCSSMTRLSFTNQKTS